MNERDKELWGKSQQWDSSDDGRGKLKILESVEKFATLIRADERKRLEQAVEELAPVRDNPILQNKPAAFWVENFKQIVRGDV